MSDKDPDEHIWKTTRYQLGPSNIPKSTIRYEPVTLLEDFSTVSTETSPDGNRLYTLGNHKYPSITTVLKATDKEGAIALSNWRRRMGTEVASKITAKASFTGSTWHEFAEKWVTNVPFDWRYFIVPNSARQGAALASTLNSKIESVIASETPIMSHRLKVAGRMDIGAQLLDGRLCILDFKTGRKLKKANRLRQAAKQCCFYAQALTEQLPFGSVDTVVIVQILPDAIYWQESPVSYWVPMLEESIAEYSKKVIRND